MNHKIMELAVRLAGDANVFADSVKRDRYTNDAVLAALRQMAGAITEMQQLVWATEPDEPATIDIVSSWIVTEEPVTS